VVLATNVYRKGARGWRMVSHHGGLAPLEAHGQSQQPSVH